MTVRQGRLFARIHTANMCLIPLINILAVLIPVDMFARVQHVHFHLCICACRSWYVRTHTCELVRESKREYSELLPLTDVGTTLVSPSQSYRAASCSSGELKTSSKRVCVYATRRS